MRVTVTGATGLIGTGLIARLKARGDEVTVLSRDPARARETLGAGWEVVRWDPDAGPAPREALDGRDGVVHLAGEPVAQRWTKASKERIRRSRELGTRHLLAGIRAAEPKPGALVSSSAVGYYGPHGDEELTEATPPGSDFLAEVCVAWERRPTRRSSSACGWSRFARASCSTARAARSRRCSALPAQRRQPGGRRRAAMSWIHADDVVGILIAALDDDRWTGAVNATAPAPVTNQAFSKALGQGPRASAFAPVPALAIRARSTGRWPRSSPRAAGGPQHAGARVRLPPRLLEALRSAVGK